MHTKLSFRECAEDMERLCDQIDDLEGEELGVLVLELLDRSKHTLQESVDRRIAFIRYCESQEAKARELRNAWEARLRKFEKLTEKIKTDTLETMKANPGVPFHGTHEKFRVQKNSQPKLVHPLTLRKEQIEVVEIDEFAPLLDTFIESKIVHVLRKDLLKDAIKQGFKQTGVSLEIGEHIRIGVK